MEPINIMLWLSTMTKCSFLLSNGNYSTEQSLIQIIHKEPWKLLKSVSFPKGCATLLLEEVQEYDMAIPHLSKIQSTEVLVILIVQNSSKEAMMSLEENHSLEFDHDILQIDDNGKVTAHLSHFSPFDVNGQALKRQLRVSLVKYTPFVTSLGPPPTGSDVEVVEALASRLNLKVTYLVIDTFENLVRTVANQSADMCITHPSIVTHRYAWGVDVMGIDFMRLHFGQRHAQPVNSFYAISYPYSRNVWMATAATSVSIALLLVALNIFYGNSAIAFKEITISYIPLISQSVSPNWYGRQESVSYFIILFSWLLLASVWSQAYRSNLLASLVKQDIEQQPQTVQEVVDLGLGLYMFSGAVQTKYLKESPFNAHRQLYFKNLLVHGGFYEGAKVPSDVEDKILDGKAVTILVDDATATTEHLFSKSKEIIKKSMDGYYLRLGLPLKKELLIGIARLQDFGIIHETIHRVDWHSLRPWRELQKSKFSNEMVLGVSHILPVMIVLAIGLSLGGLSLFLYELQLFQLLYKYIMAVVLRKKLKKKCIIANKYSN